MQKLNLKRVKHAKINHNFEATKHLVFKSTNFNLSSLMYRFLTLILLLSFSSLFCQTSIGDLKEISEKIYGPDNVLINGSSYVISHPSANGNPFLGDNKFTPSTINLKGRSFNNVLIKYDIEFQMVILKVDNSYGSKIITLRDNYIKAFNLHNKHFINLKEKGINDKSIKFLELVYDGSFIFGNYYSKSFLSIYSNKYPNGKYTKTKVSHYLFLNNKKINIKNKRDLLLVFPEHKHDIKKFIKKNKIKFRKATNADYFKIMHYCDEFE